MLRAAFGVAPGFAHPCFTFRCLSMQGVPGFELVPRQLDAVLRRF